MANRLKLTRDQLYRLFGNPRVVEQFEQLFATMDEAEPGFTDAVLIAAGNADATSNDAVSQIAELAERVLLSTAETRAAEALDRLDAIAKALDAIALAPRNVVDTEAREAARAASLEAGLALAMASQAIDVAQSDDLR